MAKVSTRNRFLLMNMDCLSAMIRLAECFSLLVRPNKYNIANVTVLLHKENGVKAILYAIALRKSALPEWESCRVDFYVAYLRILWCVIGLNPPCCQPGWRLSPWCTIPATGTWELLRRTGNYRGPWWSRLGRKRAGRRSSSNSPPVKRTSVYSPSKRNGTEMNLLRFMVCSVIMSRAWQLNNEEGTRREP